MTSFHVWTVGCQMNVADSDRVSAGMAAMGLQREGEIDDADVVVLNTCVVRQSAEDTATGLLGKLKKVKRRNPGRLLAVMGCMVGPDKSELKRRFPQVDVWARPQEFEPIVQAVALRHGYDYPDSDGCLTSVVPETPKVATYVPITHGCDKFCSFCIIPYRRGRETSRPQSELLDEIGRLVQRGVKEVTLLGQNVDSYGHDLPQRLDLADLLSAVNDISGVERVRFLTSHPNDMSRRIIDAIRDLPKVCEVVNLPFQAGDDTVLANMRRGYTRTQYLEKVDEVRESIGCGVTITTDVIVGFPGETETQFLQTMDVLSRVRFDKVHSAIYSERPGTLASRTMPDDVEVAEKRKRHRYLDEFQQHIQREINGSLVGSPADVLVEGTQRGRVYGRSRLDKLVYMETETGLGRSVGHTIGVQIVDSTPFSLMGAPTGHLNGSGQTESVETTARVDQSVATIYG